LPCVEGKFCPEATADDGAGTGALVEACPDGFYCPTGTQFKFEFPCPAGTRSPAPNTAVQAGDCVTCDAGEYCASGTGPAAGASIATPVPCPANSWCEAGDEFGRSCPSGKYAASPGSTLEADCVECEAGSYCPLGSGKLACPEGTYQDSANTGACITSPEGNAVTAAGSGNADTACGAGTHAKAGETGCHDCLAGHQCAGDSTEVICAVGTYADAGQAGCTPCVAGQQCLRAGMASPEPCPSGHYCPDPAVAATPTPAGSFSYGGPGATEDPSATQQCHLGYTCADDGGIGPHAAPCEAGTFSASGDATCGPTSDGSYTLRGQGSETDCPLGYYCSQDEAYYPIPCPKGTYGHDTGLPAAVADPGPARRRL
jgi:hypothetical protein